ncbi:hypothetical protein ACFLSJ_03335 [Verrucomicrobiota bacterium]
MGNRLLSRRSTDALSLVLFAALLGSAAAGTAKQAVTPRALDLNAGEIAFVGFNADGDDDFAIVTLVAVPAHTVFYFRDDEWDGSAFSTGEGSFQWDSGDTEIAAGTVIAFGAVSDSPSPSHGSVSNGTIALSVSNEGLWAYHGSDADTPTAFLAFFGNDDVESTGSSLDNTGLTEGNEAIGFDGDDDVFEYKGPRSGFAASAYRMMLNNPGHWDMQGGTGDQHEDGIDPDIPFNSTAFVIGGASTTIATTTTAGTTTVGTTTAGTTTVSWMSGGDVAFVGYNADADDDFAIVTFAPLPPHTVIHFRDDEWEGTAFNSGEGNITWDSGDTLIDAGTVITFGILSATPSTSHGTVLGGSMNLSSQNEGLWAYVGPDADTPTTFLAFFGNDDVADTGNTVENTGLTEGDEAIGLVGDDDVIEYVGVRTGHNAAGYRALLNDIANWVTQDGSGDQSDDGTEPDLPLDDTPFVLEGGSTTTTTSAVGSTTTSTTVVTTTGATTTGAAGPFPITDITYTVGNTVIVEWVAADGVPYVLQGSTGLLDRPIVWTDIGLPVMGPQNLKPDSLGDAMHKYYRVVVPSPQ